MSVDSSIDRCQRVLRLFFPTHFLAHYELAIWMKRVEKRGRERKIALIVLASEISVDSPRGYIFIFHSYFFSYFHMGGLNVKLCGLYY